MRATEIGKRAGRNELRPTGVKLSTIELKEGMVSGVGAALAAAQAARRSSQSEGPFGLAPPSWRLGSRQSCPYCMPLETQQRLT